MMLMFLPISRVFIVNNKLVPAVCCHLPRHLEMGAWCLFRCGTLLFVSLWKHTSNYQTQNQRWTDLHTRMEKKMRIFVITT